MVMQRDLNFCICYQFSYDTHGAFKVVRAEILPRDFLQTHGNLLVTYYSQNSKIKEIPPLTLFWTVRAHPILDGGGARKPLPC